MPRHGFQWVSPAASSQSRWWRSHRPVRRVHRHFTTTTRLRSLAGAYLTIGWDRQNVRHSDSAAEFNAELENAAAPWLPATGQDMEPLSERDDRKLR